ncbi:metal-dependent hydrolase [Aquimarina algicola]|uniref:Metal-dependent hydrolase n=1 Tax=Aquimarina algicola TaxID=2589995 RepID=A0A504IV94_9FLAO|nr:metal-dependent hydrolase [Aquimarina algicola]TPN82266.1 metal-dependent hydrolase [Aquimarina algicola]
MDSLTQIVLGAAVGEAVLGKKVGNKAMLWGAIAGTTPDLDTLSNLFVDPITANEWHRGFSHSLLFCVLFSPLFGWLIAKLYKNKEADWKDWTKLMFFGLFTHPILDAFTTWGTQLFWPFSYKISFKNIFVIDPLYTVPFLICVIIALFYKRTNPKRQKINKTGLYISSGYMVITLLLKWYTYKVFEENVNQQHIQYNEIQTKPTPLNSILWTANIETEDAFLIGYYSIFQKKDMISFARFPKNRHLLDTFNNDPLIARLVNLSQGWYTVEKINNKIYFNDLRFGQLGVDQNSSQFVFSYELFYDENGNLMAKEREKNMKEAGPLLKKLFARIFDQS